VEFEFLDVAGLNRGYMSPAIFTFINANFPLVTRLSFQSATRHDEAMRTKVRVDPAAPVQ